MKNRNSRIFLSENRNIVKTKISIYNFCFVLLLVASIFSNAFSTVYKGAFSHLVSYTYHLMIPLLFVIAAVDVLKNGSRKKDALLLISLAVIILISALKGYTSITDIHSVFVGTACFMEMLIMIFISSKVKVTQNLVNFIFTANIVIAVIYIIESRFNFAYFYITRGKVINFGLNSNFAGMLLMINAVILLIAIHYYKNWKLKLTFLIVFLSVVYLIMKTQSRTSMIGIGIVILLSLKKKIKITKARVIMITLIPVLFPFIYLSLEAIPYFQNLILYGKNFYSGRNVIYQLAFQNIGEWFWLGDFKNKFLNAHNGPLSITLTIGIFGLINYYLYLWMELFDLIKKFPKVKSRVRISSETIAFISIIILFIHACSEAAFFVFGQQLSVSVGSLYLLSRGNGMDEDIK